MMFGVFAQCQCFFDEVNHQEYIGLVEAEDFRAAVEELKARQVGGVETSSGEEILWIEFPTIDAPEGMSIDFFLRECSVQKPEVIRQKCVSFLETCLPPVN